MQSMATKLAASMIAADCPLEEQVREAEQAGVDRIHIDVMDGHFVPARRIIRYRRTHVTTLGDHRG